MLKKLKMRKTVSESIKYRRSVRKYLNTDLDEEKVRYCIKNATLAPNSSNMQLWEFYQVVNKVQMLVFFVIFLALCALFSALKWKILGGGVDFLLKVVSYLDNSWAIFALTKCPFSVSY